MTTKQVVTRIAKVVFCISWFVLGLTQALIGFLNNGQCDKSKHLPMFLGIHGIINGICGIIVMPCFLIEHNGFYARLIFYTFWGINGVLILYGVIQSGVTHADILSCVQNCDSCANVVSVGALITEILIFILFFFASIIAITYECRTRGQFCRRNGETRNNASYDPANQQEHPTGIIPSAPPAYR
ncbi:hypothetical protein CHS0354_014731 [Potamilus streckersoni]|uniref:Uncharacterized protein n=1 Tax=Potamilus streckersoni TaxID=2493646 RepID=A0AAE0SQU2_9BIVA|nr:hypothetical protein CHS0354_014731 [Potamilus streckersoni]